MRLATTTGDLERWFPTYEEQLAEIARAGFRNVDLSMYRMGRSHRFLGEDWEREVDKVAECAARLGLTFVQAHSIGGNPLCRDENFDHLLAATVRSVEVCGKLGIPATVVHSGVMAGIGQEEYYRLNRDFYRLLFPAMEKTGVAVLIENSCKPNMGGNYFFFDGQDMKDFLRYADHPLLHACWDTGHANVEGHQYEDIVALGDDLWALHINDNRGGGDEHVMPFLGTTSFDEVMQALAAIGYSRHFTLECDSSLRSYLNWQGNRRAFGEKGPLAEPPRELAVIMEQALCVAGAHLLRAYGYEVE